MRLLPPLLDRTSPMATDTPTDTARLAEPTVERTQNFYDLLCELGIDAVLDRALSGAAPVRKSGKSDWASGAEIDGEPKESRVQIDLGPMFLALMRNGGAQRLAQIVLDGTPDQVSRAPMALVQEGLRFFVGESLLLIGQLIGFGEGLASPARPAPATPTRSESTST